MRRKSILVTAAAVIAATAATAANAQDRVRWKMHSAWASNIPHIGTTAVRLTENVRRMSGGNFDISAGEAGDAREEGVDFFVGQHGVAVGVGVG